MAPTSLLAVLGLSALGLAKDIATAFFSGLAALLGSGASHLLAALLGFISTTSDPVFSGGWWSGPGEALFQKVLAVSGSLLALAFMCSIVTAVISGDHRLLARATRRLPLAVIEMALLVAVTAALVSASDELSVSLASGTSARLGGFLAVGLAGAISASGIVGLIAGGLVVLSGIVIWVELLCRTALIYVAVMAGPLIFATSVHPSVSGLKRRYIESGLALIFSKVIIALAFATGAAMLSGAGQRSSFAASLGALLQALAILLVCCFAPFVLLKLLLGAEAIIATEGLERRPVRAALGGLGAATSAAGFASMLSGLGGNPLARSLGGAPPTSSPTSPGSPRTPPSGGSPSPGSGGPSGPKPPASPRPSSSPRTPTSPSAPGSPRTPGSPGSPSAPRPPASPGRRVPNRPVPYDPTPSEPLPPAARAATRPSSSTTSRPGGRP